MIKLDDELKGTKWLAADFPAMDAQTPATGKPCTLCKLHQAVNGFSGWCGACKELFNRYFEAREATLEEVLDWTLERAQHFHEQEQARLQRVIAKQAQQKLEAADALRSLAERLDGRMFEQTKETVHSDTKGLDTTEKRALELERQKAKKLAEYKRQMAINPKDIGIYGVGPRQFAGIEQREDQAEPRFVIIDDVMALDQAQGVAERLGMATQKALTHMVGTPYKPRDERAEYMRQLAEDLVPRRAVFPIEAIESERMLREHSEKELMKRFVVGFDPVAPEPKKRGRRGG